MTDDPRTAIIDDPTFASVVQNYETTAINLLHFSATADADGTTVEWETGTEIGTWGFHLLRSVDDRRASARRVTTDIILGRGSQSSGAAYTWRDEGLTAGTTTYYWLQEIEQDETVNEYGPVRATQAMVQQHQPVYLPLVIR